MEDIKTNDKISILYKWNSKTIIISLYILSYLFFELGYFLGSWNVSAESETVREDVNSHFAGVITLLGLLLAFTFSMASDRYEERKKLAIEEANEIGSAYMNIHLFTDSSHQELRKLIVKYIDLRITYYEIGIDKDTIIKISKETYELQRVIWKIVATEVKEKSNLIFNSIINNFNKMFDLAEQRDAATENHVPTSIFWLLYLITILNMFAMGYGSGLVFFKSIGYALLLNLCNCMTLYIIMNLDRPREGKIKVSQQNMLALRNNINRL